MRSAFGLRAAVTLVGPFAACMLHAAEPPEAATEVWSPPARHVDTVPGQPPSDAIVLFDGTSLDAWEPVASGGVPWVIQDGAMVIVPSPRPTDHRTKRSFGDVQLHLEWRVPAEPKGQGQDRGNSGVFFMGLYELQILDSYENPTYVNGQAGAIYKESPPLVDAARRPGEWQTYDVVFIAPRFGPDGQLRAPARMTVLHNGVLVQHNVALTGPTPNGPTFHQSTLPPYAAHPAKLPLVLQDHRCVVAFRNLWIRELTLPENK